MNSDETIVMNGMQPKDDEMKWNHKKRAKYEDDTNPFLLFCETVLNHEKELLSETLNSSQESISENLAPIDGQNNSSIENSTFNSDSDGGANGEISKNFTNNDDGGDSFNSVTCFCGKPFAGRPMIECSGCLTWLHMSCVKVKRKNIPEFYYCDNCKSNGLLSPSSNAIGSSGEEGTPFSQQNGTVSSNNAMSDGILYSSTHQNNQNTTNNTIITTTGAAASVTKTKPKKPKTLKKSSAASLMNSSDNIKNNTNSDSKYLSKKSSTVNGKLKKIRQTKKVETSSALTKSNSASTLAAAALLTALSVNNLHTNGISAAVPTTPIVAPSPDNSNNLLKSPIATNNNIYNNGDVIETTQSERTSSIFESNGSTGAPLDYRKERNRSISDLL